MASTSKKVALITGGTTGIGLATAQLLHEQGYSVVITGKNPETLEAAKQKLPKDVVILRSDASQISEAGKIAEEMKERFGKLDVLFLNAAAHMMAPIEAVNEESYDDHFDLNVKGPFFTLQKLLPLVGEGGSIIFNCSLSATRSVSNFSVYSATKGALLSAVKALAVELAPRGIRVNAVTPGPIDTPAFGKLGLPPEALKGFAESLATKVPLGRIGKAAEVATVVAFLASSAASYVTGTYIAVDGGMAALAFS